MSNITGVSQSIGLIKSSYKKYVSFGEKAVSSDYRMLIQQYPNLEYLIHATQLPELKREIIEDYGPHGVMFNQQGRYKNAVDITITFKEIITGEAYKCLRDWVRNKRYLDVWIGLMGESSPESNEHNTLLCEDVWCELDATDLSNEDNTTLIKPSGLLHVNWHSWVDAVPHTLEWAGA
jgi:hypothetical protein